MKVPRLCLHLSVMALAACKQEPPPEAPAPPTPAPTPAPTPHPAMGAQEAAKRLYPDLAKENSLFHRTFLEVFQDTRTNHPMELTTVGWPLSVARRTAEILGVEPTVATPVPNPAPKTVAKPSVLERGAYNQSRVVIRRYPTPTPYR